jgi:hypothetical protein
MSFHQALSPEDMGMVRYEEEDDEHHLHQKSPPAYQEVTGSNPGQQAQSPPSQEKPDPLRLGPSNRSNSLGIQYVDVDDEDSSDEDDHAAATLKGGADTGYHQQRSQSGQKLSKANNSPARKSSHNISQHAIDALLGMSTASHDQAPARAVQVREGTEPAAIFAISSDKESEMDNQMHPQRLFESRQNSRQVPAAYEAARPSSLDLRVSGGSHSTTSPDAANQRNATRRIASPQNQRPVSTDSGNTAELLNTTPLLHANIRQTVPFEGDVPPSPAPTDGGYFFPPEVSPQDTNDSTATRPQAAVLTPPASQVRNPSPQRLPSRRVQVQNAPMHLGSSSAGNIRTNSTNNVSSNASANSADQLTRQRSSRRPLATSSAELVGPGVVLVQPTRRGQDEHDIDAARRRSMSPGLQRLSSQSNSTQSLGQSQFNMNLPSVSTGNLAANSQSMYGSLMLPGNGSMLMTQQANNLALQQAILQQQQMQQLQQQQLQQLQQQQQQLQLMAAMGMTTVPMVAANGMIYQQPIVAVMQNNAIAMNSLTNSLAAIAASLALIAASPAVVAPTTLAPNSLASSSGLIATALPAVVPAAPAAAVVPPAAVSLEEQLLSRQRRVERENDMQLRMAIEQSLQDVVRPQARRASSGATLSSTSSVSTMSSVAPAAPVVSRSSSQPRGAAASSTVPSRAMSPSNGQQRQMEDADDAALQLALMMSLEEQHHEDEYALQQAYEFSLCGSVSPSIREQQQTLLSRQASRQASRQPSRQPSPAVGRHYTDDLPPLPHGHTHSHTHSHASSHNSSHNGSAHNMSSYTSSASSATTSPYEAHGHRAPSRERVISFQRRTREEILQERAHQHPSRQPSPSLGPSSSQPHSGLTSQTGSNHSSFHGHVELHHPPAAAGPAVTSTASTASATQVTSPPPNYDSVVVGSTKSTGPKPMIRIQSFTNKDAHGRGASSTHTSPLPPTYPALSPMEAQTYHYPPEYASPPPPYEELQGVTAKKLVRHSTGSAERGTRLSS